MSRILLEGVTKLFAGSPAIDALDLEIEAGEFFCLLGPSGCGKTTTMRCITGLERPEKGRILIGDRLVFDGTDLTFVPTAKRQIGMVFQNYALWPHMTVRDNALFGLRMKRVDKATQQKRLSEILELLQTGNLANRYPGELSGGQQQRVALARELVADAEVLVLDEPLSNLDAQLRIDMRFELKRLHEQTGRTFIYITHDQTEAMTLSSRMAVMRDGRIRQLGTPSQVYEAPEELFVATFIGSGSVGINQLPVRFEGGRLVGTGFELPAPAGLTAQPGTNLVLAVRPEEASLAMVGDSTKPGVDGHIISEMPMGHVALVHLRIGDADTPVIKVLQERHRPLSRNAPVRLHLPQDAMHLYEANTGKRLRA